MTAPWEQASAALVADAVRNRDELWCRALVATLDIDAIERVTRAFNARRPADDPVGARTLRLTISDRR